MVRIWVAAKILCNSLQFPLLSPITLHWLCDINNYISYTLIHCIFLSPTQVLALRLLAVVLSSWQHPDHSDRMIHLVKQLCLILGKTLLTCPNDPTLSYNGQHARLFRHAFTIFVLIIRSFARSSPKIPVPAAKNWHWDLIRQFLISCQVVAEWDELFNAFFWFQKCIECNLMKLI